MEIVPEPKTTVFPYGYAYAIYRPEDLLVTMSTEDYEDRTYVDSKVLVTVRSQFGTRTIVVDLFHMPDGSRDFHKSRWTFDVKEMIRVENVTLQLSSHRLAVIALIPRVKLKLVLIFDWKTGERYLVSRFILTTQRKFAELFSRRAR